MAGASRSSSTGSAAQQWRVAYTNDGYYTLQPQSATVNRLDVRDYLDQDGATVQISGNNLTAAQKFKIVSRGGGVFTLRPQCAPTRALDGQGSNAIVHLWDYNSSYTQQQWVFEPLLTPLIAQEQDQWCWAASIRMVTGTAESQSALAIRAFGQASNLPLGIVEILNIANDVRASGTPAFTLQNSARTEAQIRTSIDNGRAIMVRILWNSGGGHIIVIYGYRQIGGTYQYLIHDPWQPTVGASIMRTYAQITIVIMI